ncbi:LysM domain-containing protein [Paenibacillus allorhizosphaerae]|uniref:LysM domain-containing protein n=1 Tax=Paenibacillus allorhizosphaerae TaxID=2849866 RepID=A0ABM8VMK8_9BACL|nr:LysM domain-containing protein [Paenibacillus allorhizosphaerae]CAG7650141.1 hypothetical protein PAECIP111802_04649 [Paenibacillus allorhizosphaerae]
MDRAFFPFGGFGPFGFGPFGGFGAPFFFPGRSFFPFFTLSPFFFPFFRGEEDRDGTYYAQHHCQEGDSYERLADMYNVPQPILETMNPHIEHPQALSPGHIVYIPRLNKMYCHKMYLEQETAGAENAAPMYTSPMQAAPYPMQIPQYPAPNAGPTAAYPMHTGPNAAYPYTGK